MGALALAQEVAVVSKPTASDLREKLYAARQIINAVVAAAEAQFDYHYALETVEEMLIDVTDALVDENSDDKEALS
jgi:hypothetical protein